VAPLSVKQISLGAIKVSLEQIKQRLDKYGMIGRVARINPGNTLFYSVLVT